MFLFAFAALALFVWTILETLRLAALVVAMLVRPLGRLHGGRHRGYILERSRWVPL